MHNASLLHDDVIDGDRMRRSRPALWITFGVPAAILAGDALFFLATQVLLEAGSPLASAGLAELNTAVQDLIDGEYADVTLQDQLAVPVAESQAMAQSKCARSGYQRTGYSTVKVAYAIELGGQVQPTEGWLRHEAGPYLDPWHKHLRAAYIDIMAALGVPTDLAERDPLAFLDAMARLKQGDPAELAVLTAIKQTAKGTIGKLRERPRQGWKPGQRWAALERPTWDPLMRALVIDTATVNLHRKLRRMTDETGRHAFAVLSDCAVFAAPGPGAIDVLTRPDGTLTTALRLGISPGHVKFEGSRPMAEIRELMADGVNPGRHMKASGQVSDDE